MAGTRHRLGSEQVHCRFKADIRPILIIEDGDIVEMECREGFDGQVDPPVEAADLNQRTYETIDWRRLAPLTGPVAIKGAEPGDTLEVRILDLMPFGTGNLLLFPAWMDGDFLSSDMRKAYPDAWIRHYNMDEAVACGGVDFAPGLRVPLRPMLGVMGTAPAEGEFTTTGAPRYFGGNMDISQLGKGVRIYFPVSQPGAQFSAGDGHGVQGDGEIGSTGLETPMRATLEFHLHKARTIAAVQFETADEFMMVGFGRNLDIAGQRAIGSMVEYLHERQGLTREEAYALLSLAGDLRVNQVVDYPNLGARVAIRKDLFAKWQW